MLGELFEDAKKKKEEKLEAEKAMKDAKGSVAWYLIDVFSKNVSKLLYFVNSIIIEFFW